MKAFSVKLKVLKSLLLAINPKDVKYFLQGIYVDPAGVLVATNGHWMATWDLEGSPEDNDYIIPYDVISSLIKSLPGKANYDTVIYIDSGSIEYGTTKIEHTPVDGKFPNWKKIIPEYGQPQEVSTLSYNIKYMYDIHTAYKYLTGKSDMDVHINITFPNGENVTAPTKLASPLEERFTTYLMEKRI